MTSIERVDPADDAVFAALHDVYLRAHDRDIDQPYTALEKRVGLRSDDYKTMVALLARDDGGTPVGGGWAQMPLRDNLAFVFFDVFVAPEHRRRGHGSVLLAALEDLAREAGRSTMFTEASWLMDEDEPVAKAFADARGYRLDLLDAHRVLDLPADLPRLRLSEGYTLHGWRGRCPDEWAQGYADVRGLMVQEAPSGDAPLENEFWDVGRVRREEEMWEAQQRVPQVSVAQAADGTLVGHTQLVFSLDSENVYQWDTLVLPEHRGHGLGLALKVFTMQEAADLLEGRRRIHTYNAASNVHMIAVNEKLGFRQASWSAELVRDL
ncbi:GNAT family N-acetyltransferase [Aeromicrobium terrae]|uniref:GNAT family N-acetyltransferase n=1 Tax=Aeromicrobium terrae TaxID=2498846 RepID=A0A5C8NJ30_9ACTN|nr:GNAT family N-acetyltransferase [Aeromicrobium terrae]TXL58086.1 GNAT family N-acetyltransferase [Aeromicrobium terrae]